MVGFVIIWCDYSLSHSFQYMVKDASFRSLLLRYGLNLSSSSRVILRGASYCTNVMQATGRYFRRVVRARV